MWCESDYSDEEVNTKKFELEYEAQRDNRIMVTSTLICKGIKKYTRYYAISVGDILQDDDIYDLLDILIL